MRLECDQHGIVEAVTSNEYYVYSECGVENICLKSVPVSRCPYCKEFLEVTLRAAAYLHSVISIALRRKRTLTDKEKALIQKVDLMPEARREWWYNRRGQLIECYDQKESR